MNEFIINIWISFIGQHSVSVRQKVVDALAKHIAEQKREIKRIKNQKG